MVIDLTKCAERPLEVHERLEVSPRFAPQPEIVRVDPVETRFQVSPVGPGRFLVRGNVQAALTATCVRCLELFAVALGTEFTLTYFPASQRPESEAGECPMRVEEVDVSYYEDDRIEVLPLVEEQLTLAMPMRFLCAEDCRGLCAACGSNRNRTTCSCLPPRPDPRLEVLKTLLH